jgi:hypothetical protein
MLIRAGIPIRGPPLKQIKQIKQKFWFLVLLSNFQPISTLGDTQNSKSSLSGRNGGKKPVSDLPHRGKIIATASGGGAPCNLPLRD